MRKLASIQVVKGTAPIDGADAIEVAFVQGWQVVVRKGEFKAGDLVVFYEIDSFLPASDERYFSFKERFITWEGKEGMRLRTIKLRKTLSQGLVLPVSNFPEIVNPVEGMDVTELLKIEKWEIAEKVNTTGRTQGSGKSFPSFIQKTDQERVQNYGALVEKAYEADEQFEVTMKKDGSSITVFVVQPNSKYYKASKDFESKKSKFNLIQWIMSFFKKDNSPITGVCSRNLVLPKEGDSNFHKVVKKYNLIEKAISTGKSIALQGELVAPDIQGNHEKVDDVEFHLFDVFDIDKQQYMLPEERKALAFEYDIPHVTTLTNGNLKSVLSKANGSNVVEKCLDYAEGNGDNAGVKREGVVFKSLTRDFSFKAISNSYLLKKG